PVELHARRAPLAHDAHAALRGGVLVVARRDRVAALDDALLSRELAARVERHDDAHLALPRLPRDEAELRAAARERAQRRAPHVALLPLGEEHRAPSVRRRRRAVTRHAGL